MTKTKTSLLSHIQFARRLTRLLDLKFSIFGIKFGIDPLLNIIPNFGNILATCTSFYLFWIAYKLKVPSWVYVRMIWNMSVDYILGAVPVVGVVFDVFFRSNVKNFALLEQFFDPDILEGELADA